MTNEQAKAYASTLSDAIDDLVKAEVDYASKPLMTETLRRPSERVSAFGRPL